MVTVTQTPVQQPVEVGGILEMVFSPIGWIFSHFFQLFFIALLVIIVVLVFIFYFMKEEEKKEQEDMMYKDYKNTIRSAIANRDETMYMTKWSKWNIIFLGLPIIRVKYGRQVFNRRQKLVGYYNGMFIDMMGNINLLLWKTKTMGMFKNEFVLRLPTKARNIQLSDKKNAKRNDSKKFDIECIDLPKDAVVFNETDKTFTIKMINHKKSGYYYYPVYEGKEFEILDLTSTIKSMDLAINNDILLEEVIKVSGKNVANMAKVNTELTFEQRVPQKVEEVNKDD